MVKGIQKNDQEHKDAYRKVKNCIDKLREEASNYFPLDSLTGGRMLPVIFGDDRLIANHPKRVLFFAEKGFPILKLIKEGNIDAAKQLYKRTVYEIDMNSQSGKDSIKKDEQGKPIYKLDSIELKTFNDWLTKSELASHIVYEIVLAEKNSNFRGGESLGETYKNLKLNKEITDDARVKGFAVEAQKIRANTENFTENNPEQEPSALSKNIERRGKDDIIQTNNEYSEKARKQIETMRKEKEKLELEQAQKNEKTSNDLKTLVDPTSEKGKRKDRTFGK